MSNFKPLKPRHGRVLKVLVVTRISGCQNQQELSLEDQAEHAKEDIAALYDGPCDFHIISTVEKGERLDRKELGEVADRLRSVIDDVVFMEDVGRLIRGTAAVELWGIAVDNGIRCIAPNDGCDTAETTWEEDLISACKDHVSHCAHTSRRIKYKQMIRFKRNGGAIPLPVYGYIKPEGAKYYSELLKDESARVYLEKGLEILRRTQNWTAVADYFNSSDVPTGPYCKNKKWDGAMVKRYYHNPLLKGMPQRGAHHSVKQNSTGRRISVPNPDGPTFRDEPHLAFFTPEELDAIIDEMDNKNKNRGRVIQAGGVKKGSKKRSRFPGQRATCWYCGRTMVWGGNGVTDSMMCNGSRHYQCWNSFGIPADLAAQQIVDAITNELENVEGFDEQLAEMVQLMSSAIFDAKNELRSIESEESQLQRDQENLKKRLLELGQHEIIIDMIGELEQRENELERRRIRLQYRNRQRPQLPESGKQLREMFRESFHHLALDSFECGDLLRQLVPEFYVYLVQLIDGGKYYSRAKVKISLGGIIRDIDRVPEIQEFLTRELTLDLFTPPIHERIREEVIKRESQGQYQRQIAADLGTHQATVQKALRRERMMRERGLTSPYHLITERPDKTDNRNFKRSRHDRYHFEQLEGYVPPEL